MMATEEATGEAPEEFFPLQGNEIVLDDPAEIYLRQCTGPLTDNTEPSVMMFRESSKDGGKLSGARSSKVDAREAYEYRIAHPGEGNTETKGTFGVAVEEVGAAGESCGVPLRVVDDSLLNEPGTTPGHAYLDQRHISELPSHPDKRAVRARLFLYAMERKRLWPPPDLS